MSGAQEASAVALKLLTGRELAGMTAVGPPAVVVVPPPVVVVPPPVVVVPPPVVVVVVVVVLPMVVPRPLVRVALPLCAAHDCFGLAPRGLGRFERLVGNVDLLLEPIEHRIAVHRPPRGSARRLLRFGWLPALRLLEPLRHGRGWAVVVRTHRAACKSRQGERPPSTALAHRGCTGAAGALGCEYGKRRDQSRLHHAPKRSRYRYMTGVV